MKKSILTTVVSCLLATIAFAQAPQTFSYQTVVRDNNWQVLANQSIGVKVAIIEDVASGTTVYEEEHTATTNDIGLINLAIGGGTVAQGLFSNIDWGNHSYFMKIAVDVSGGSTYVVMGTTQLRSVPYALFAETSNNAGPQGIQGVAGNDGADGTNGTNGVDGNDGAAGTNGTNGIDGIDGNDGATGLTGVQGIQGATGNDGTNGTNGIDGAAGATGAIGLTGNTGAAGTNGINGTNGVDGAVGATGATGTNGANGLDGAVGATGIQGTIGLTGNTGAAGTNGIDGAVGLTGANGVDGYTPMFGVDYNNGANGLDGAVGATGAQGLVGNSIWQQDSLNNISYNNGNVNIGSTVIDSSAALTISSQTQGVMLPSMNKIERDSIDSPTTGLLIFQNDGTAGFYFYNGNEWTMIGGGITEFDPTLIYTTDGF